MLHEFDHVVDRRGTNSYKWKTYSEDVLPMWVADMDFSAPEPILQALHDSVNHGILGYEYPSQSLLETVARRMDILYGWKLDPEMIVVTQGGVCAFNVAANMLCQSGTGYLIQPPVYMHFNDIEDYFSFTRQEATLSRRVNEHNINYVIDWDQYKSAINSRESKTKMFLLCNPHNPIGKIFSAEELRKMANICLENEIVIVSDEYHSELLLSDQKFTPIASLSQEISNYSITLISPSKPFNIPGLFCGFAVIPNPELRNRYIKAIDREPFNVSSLSLAAAQAAYSDTCDTWLKELRTYLTANRNLLVSFVKEYLSGVYTTIPDAGFLAWLDCNELKNEGIFGTNTPYDFFLNNAKVALNDGSSFGTGGSGFVRLNFGCPRKTLTEGLDRIATALKKA